MPNKMRVLLLWNYEYSTGSHGCVRIDYSSGRRHRSCVFRRVSELGDAVRMEGLGELKSEGSEGKDSKDKDTRMK